jgi:hypothetical protein
MTHLESLGYFLSQGSVLLNGCSSEKPMLMGGPECASYLAWFCTLSMCTFTSLTLAAEYWGSRRHVPPNKTIT